MDIIVIDKQKLLSQIGTGGAAIAVIEYAKVRSGYLVNGIAKAVDKHQIEEIIEYGSQLNTLALGLCADPITIIVDEIILHARKKEFPEVQVLLSYLQEVDKLLKKELANVLT
jgi:hypothetical protein